MSLNLRVIEVSEIEEVLEFENRKLKEHFPDEMERQIHSWNSLWRKESLEHYFRTGWSFLARENLPLNSQDSQTKQGELVGYFMAQPLLFFEGQTQSLWIEHIQFSTLQARDELCDLAWRLAREKHFQRVYFPAVPGLVPTLKSMNANPWGPEKLFIKTTKV